MQFSIMPRVSFGEAPQETIQSAYSKLSQQSVLLNFRLFSFPKNQNPALWSLHRNSGEHETHNDKPTKAVPAEYFQLREFIFYVGEWLPMESFLKELIIFYVINLLTQQIKHVFIQYNCQYKHIKEPQKQYITSMRRV